MGGEQLSTGWREGDCASNITRYGKNGCRRAKKKGSAGLFGIFAKKGESPEAFYYNIGGFWGMKRE